MALCKGNSDVYNALMISNKQKIEGIIFNSPSQTNVCCPSFQIFDLLPVKKASSVLQGVEDPGTCFNVGKHKQIFRHQ